MTHPQATEPAAAVPACRHTGCKLPLHSSPRRTFEHCVEHLTDDERVLATSDYAHHQATPYAYGTAYSTVMMGSYPDGLSPRRIGTAHAILGRIVGPAKQSLCGTYVTTVEPQPWPSSEGFDATQLCEDCLEMSMAGVSLGNRFVGRPYTDDPYVENELAASEYGDDAGD